MNKAKINLSIKEGFASKHLYEKISILETSTIKNIERGMQWVHNFIDDAVLIGGTSVVNYLKEGRDLTPDVDFLVKDISNLENKLNTAKLRFSFLRDSNGRNIGITVPEFNIDFLDAKAGNTSLHQLILKTFNLIMIGGTNLKICNPELLVIMKFEVGREKDLNDGFKILKAGVINKLTYLNYVNLLKNDLMEYESIKTYVELV